jgi:hypothetical protein
MKLVCSTEPLTPALSRRERENRIQSHNKSCDRIYQAVFRKTSAPHLLFPLLRGEGQGEGKRNTTRQ